MGFDVKLRPIYEATQEQRRFVDALFDPEMPKNVNEIARMIQIESYEIAGWLGDCTFIQWMDWEFQQRAVAGVPVAWMMVMKIAGDSAVDPNIRLRALAMYLDRFDGGSQMAAIGKEVQKSMAKEVGKAKAEAVRLAITAKKSVFKPVKSTQK